jgi:3-oxoacyl-[acyl-carrier-protein] synthase II
MMWVCRNETFMSQRHAQPQQALRPFELARDGTVFGEGAAAFVLESRQHAAARGRPILARIVQYASAFEAPRENVPLQGTAIRASIRQVLERSGVEPHAIDHVNAHGLGTVEADRAEAQAIADVLGEVPVTAPKSFFGNLGAATGAVEMAASVLAFAHGKVPVTLNYDRPDPECPVRVVHGEAHASRKPYALLLNQSSTGQAAAVLIARPDAE